MNLAQNLAASAAEHPDAPAIKLDDLVLTYSQLDAASARVAGMLAARGIGAGDRVGIMLPNVPYFPIAYYGVLRLGAVVVPMNVLLKERETGFYLSDSGAKAVIAWHDFLDAAEHGADEAGAETISVVPGEFEQLLAAAEPRAEVVERSDSDPAVILYTSGTTGTPKGADLTHGNLRSNVGTMAPLEVVSGDVILGALPLFHSFGQTCAMNTCIEAGACLTLLPRFEPAKALEMFARDRVTVFMGVPTMYSAMLHDPAAATADTSTLRLAISGGASLPGELMRAFEGQFGCVILEGYGLSETSPVASFNQPGARKVGSIGRPVAGVEMKIVGDDGEDMPQGETGEIAIKGPNVMAGYWNRPDATAEVMRGDWFLSGDVGRMDEDGYYFIVDRKKDLIIRGGYNVYPREVEEVLYEHPAVREAAVIALPHDELGEEVGAAISLKEGADATPEQVQAYVKEQVAAYKYPRQVWVLDDLPKGPTGKILKREIAVPEE
ncbi:MAG: long-chain fatty acid--CoA ligase [Baekduia sp.]